VSRTHSSSSSSSSPPSSSSTTYWCGWIFLLTKAFTGHSSGRVYEGDGQDLRDLLFDSFGVKGSTNAMLCPMTSIQEAHEKLANGISIRPSKMKHTFATVQLKCSKKNPFSTPPRSCFIHCKIAIAEITAAKNATIVESGSRRPQAALAISNSLSASGGL
jgi:hypothetical protein